MTIADTYVHTSTESERAASEVLTTGAPMKIAIHMRRHWASTSGVAPVAGSEQGKETSEVRHCPTFQLHVRVPMKASRITHVAADGTRVLQEKVASSSGARYKKGTSAADLELLLLFFAPDLSESLWIPMKGTSFSRLGFADF